MKLIGVRIGTTSRTNLQSAYTAKVLGNFAAYGPHGSVYDEPPFSLAVRQTPILPAFPAAEEGMRWLTGHSS